MVPRQICPQPTRIIYEHREIDLAQFMDANPRDALVGVGFEVDSRWLLHTRR